MKSKLPKKRAANRFDKPFETIEIKHIVSSDKTSDQRICAVMRALLEIDQILEARDSMNRNQEAA